MGGGTLDGTDGISLQGTFIEAIDGLSEVEKRRAAAGLMLITYEEMDIGLSTAERLREAQGLSSVIIQGEGNTNLFASTGETFVQIAEEAGTRLDGMSVGDLIDHYEAVTGQAETERQETEREETRRREEAERAAEERDRAEAAAEAERIRAEIATMRTQMDSQLNALSANVSAARNKLETLDSRYAAIDAEIKSLKARGKALVDSFKVTEWILDYRSRYQITFDVTIRNATSADLFNPTVTLEVSDNDERTLTRGIDANGWEGKDVAISPGATRKTAAKTNLADGTAELSADASTLDFDIWVDSYQIQGGERIRLYVSDADQTFWSRGYAAQKKACERVIANENDTRAALRNAITALEGASDAVPDIPNIQSVSC